MRLYDYAASANCYKVRLLLAQLGLAYERVPVDIFAGETLTDRFAALNPARSTPVLELDDGRTLVESGAILAYLALGSPFMPSDRFAAAEVFRWLIYEQTDVIPATGGLRFRLQTGRLRGDDPAALARHDAALSVLALLDAHLAERTFFVGDRYTIADIAMYGYLHVAHEAGVDMRPYSGVNRWLDAVAARPDHIQDLQPYPANARPGAGRSIYD